MSHKPEIKVQFHPLYELVLSLTCYINSRFYKNSDLGLKWVKEVKKQLSPELLDELHSKAFLTAHDFYYPITYLRDWDAQLGMEEVIEQLCSISKEEIITYIRSLGINEGNVNLAGIKDFNGYIEKIIASQKYMHQVLIMWYEDYFSGLDQRILQALKDEASKQQLVTRQMLEANSTVQEIIEQVTGGLNMEGVEDTDLVLLTPQYHAKPINMYNRHPRCSSFAFPVDVTLERDPDKPSPELERMLQAISDNTRLRILKFLQDEPKSFTEIVHHTGLAKSTVHHHTVILRASGLIRVKIGARRGETFELRQDAINLLPQLLHAFFKDK